MVRCLCLLSFALACSVALGFVPSPTTTSITASRTVSSSPSSLQMSDEAPEQQHPLPVVFKFLAALTIKGAKDIVNYPPMLLDNALRESQMTDDGNDDLPKADPFVMLAKLCGIMVFKTAHDAFYYSKVWADRMMHEIRIIQKTTKFGRQP